MKKYPLTTFYKNQDGLTLVEIMVVVAIIGILSMIAIPNYQDYLRASARAEAKSQLLVLSQQMERDAISKGEYATPSDIPTSDKYTISATVSKKTFTLTAAPIDDQKKDKCDKLTFNHKGEGTPSNCW